MTIFDIWFTKVMGIGGANGGKIANCGLTVEEVYSNRDSLDFEIFTPKQIERAKSTELDAVRDAYEKYLARNVKCTRYCDRDFPKCLTHFSHRPLILYYKGDLSLLDSEYPVSVVGSRHCTGDGEMACKTISRDIAKMGGVVVSGLAQGIDGLARHTCIENGGRTVAFLGTAVTDYFPKANEELQRRMEENHLVVSEYVPGAVYRSTSFIQRNRLIAAAGRVLCVIQATEKSGSLTTARYAKEMDKPIFAVPGGIYQESFRGSNGLLYEGSAMAVKDGVAIMNYLGVKAPPPDKAPKMPDLSDLSPRAKKILSAIDGAMFQSQIIRNSGLPASRVMGALTELEMEGAVVKTDSGEYIKKF